jgi:heme-degrading monooxygenase HmoA
VTRISLFERVADEDAFLSAWRAAGAALEGRGLLLRSRSDQAEYRFAAVTADDAPAPDLPGRAQTALYDPIVDDLPPDSQYECVWLNAYEVPPDEDDDFMAAWTSVRDTVKGQPGYIGSRLHRAREGDAAFRFINVAPWATVDAITAAVAQPAFAERATAIYHQAHPSLYDVVE